MQTDFLSAINFRLVASKIHRLVLFELDKDSKSESSHAHVKSSLFDFDNVKHDCFDAMIINFVNMIQIIDTSSKFNVENSAVSERVSMMRDIIVVQLELIFVLFQLRISFQLIWQNFITSINCHRFVEDDDTQIYLQESQTIVVFSIQNIEYYHFKLRLVSNIQAIFFEFRESTNQTTRRFNRRFDMLQLNMIRTHQSRRFIFHVTSSFSQIFLDDQKFSFVSRIITFDERECFAFENNRMFLVIRVYLIKHRFSIEVRNIRFNDERQRNIRLRQHTIATHDVLDDDEDISRWEYHKHRFVLAIFNFLNKFIEWFCDNDEILYEFTIVNTKI